MAVSVSGEGVVKLVRLARNSWPPDLSEQVSQDVL